MKRHRTLRLALLLLIMLHMLERLFPGADRAALVTAVAELFIAVFLVAVDVVWPVATWLVKRRKLAKTFAMTFGPDAVPAYESPVGNYEHFVNIQISSAVDIHTFNLRLVDSDKGGPIDPTALRLAEVYEHDTPHQRIASHPDGKAGCDCTCNPIIKKYAGEVLRLRVTTSNPAGQPWGGYLSFRGYDADGQIRICRQPFKLIA